VARPPDPSDAAPSETTEPSPDAGRAESRLAPDRLAGALFVLALAVFLASRLVGLSSFPIYFFGDEAVQSVRAEELVQHHFRDPESGQVLPTYFRNGLAYNIGLSVYAQVLPYLVAGHRVAVTRGVGVAFGLLAAAGVGWMLRNVFGLRSWWLGPLVLGATPTWFLHSRTAFELVLGVAFYVWFLYFYLRYRQGSRTALFAAVVAAALAFYSYNTIQPVIASTAILLCLSDLPYHLRQRRWILPAAALALLCAMPYARYLAAHPGETHRRLEEVGSVWVRPDLSTSAKLAEFGKHYAVASSAAYWYRSEPNQDLIRHRMKGWGHIFWPTLPFAAAGLAICLWRVRRPEPRAILLALVAAPVGAAVADVLVTRAMAVVVPVAVLTAIGLDAGLRVLARALPGRVLALAAFAALASVQALMARDALLFGPTWYDDYGLYGMQWGEKEVFGEIRQRLSAAPGLSVVVSPNWANGADDLARFFLGEKAVRLESMAMLSNDPETAQPDALYVMPEEEYRELLSDRKLSVTVEKTVPYPNGSPGFRFARVAPAPDWRDLLAAEREARHRLVGEEVLVGGETWQVARSAFDIGRLANLFDGDPETLARTSEANPAVFEITFPEPRPIRSVSVTTEPGRIVLKTARVAADGARDEMSVSRTVPISDPTVEVAFSGSVATRQLRIEVENVDKHEPTHMHVREIRIRP
jgi:hypothetical protein